MSEDSKTNGNTAETTWFGMDRLRLSDGEQAIEVTIGSESHWDRSHLRKLRQSGDLPGIVPIIDSDFSADGKPFAVTPVVDAPTLAELAERDELDWSQAAGIAEAAARAANEAHERGLFHGGLCPSDIHVIGDDVAIAGIGLGLGGVPDPERSAWVAPEVRDGLEPTKRSDVYSLGKVLETSLGDALDSVPRSIRRLIMWSSSDTPEARPPSAIEFASILAEGLGEDRRTYGPAFIPTAEASDLAAQASSAVSNHVPSDTARATATSGTAGIVGAGAVAGLAAGAGQLFGKGDDADDDDLDPGAVLDSATKSVHADGFSINDADVTAEVPTDIELDEPEELLLELEEEPEEPLVADYSADLSTEASAVPGTETKKVASFDYSTVDKTVQEATPERRSRVPMAVGAILLLGLAGIAWGLLSSGDDEPTDTAGGGTAVSAPAADGTDGEEAVTASSTEGSDAAAGGTTEDGTDGDAETTPTSADVETTPTSAAASDGEGEDDASSSPATEETEPSPPTTAATETAEEEPAVAEPVAMADGPIAADQAGIQLLHGVPDVDVDVYVDGKAVATGFSTGTIAGPMTMGSGDAEVAVFAAMDNPPASIDDRTDDPVGSDTVTLGGAATSIVAHLDADGNLALSEFAENLETTDPGKGRIQVRHLAAAGAVDVEVAGDVIGSVEAGDAASLQVPAGAVEVRILSKDGAVVTSANVTVGDGEFASLSVIGAPDDDTTQIVIQSYTGLATAPAAVPTGDSGLLDAADDQTGLWILFSLMGAMLLGGVALTIGRRRSLS